MHANLGRQTLEEQYLVGSFSGALPFRAQTYADWTRTYADGELRSCALKLWRHQEVHSLPAQAGGLRTKKFRGSPAKRWRAEIADETQKFAELFRDFPRQVRVSPRAALRRGKSAICWDIW